MKNKKGCLLFLSSLFVLAGCNSNSGEKEGAKPADYGYGASLDGVEAKGEWAWNDGVLSSGSLDGGSKIFNSSKKTNLELSFNAKVTECTEEVNYSFGGYVYYKDSENNVKFTVDKTKVSLDSVKGYDTQSSVSFYPTSMDMKAGVSVTATKNGDTFEFYMNNVLITSLKESFDGEGQYAFATDYAKTEFSNVAYNDYAFNASAIANSIYTPAAGMPGTWDIEGSKAKRVDDDPTSAVYESVVFNSALATNYSLTATVKFNGAVTGGFNLYGVVAYYRNDANYVIVFFNDIWADMLVKINGNQEWVGGIETPNRNDSLVDTLYCEKVGPEVNVFINDTYVKTIQSDYFNAPGSVGYDVNGALAEFEMTSLNTINRFAKPADKSSMAAINFPHLLLKEENKYTTIDATNPNGTNYGGTVYTHANLYGSDYDYEVTLDTTYLNANAANAIGVMGGTSTTSQIALLVCGNGYLDLFGIFSYKDDQEQAVEIGSIELGATFAGMGKAIPEECYTDGVLNAYIDAKVSLRKGVFTFYLDEIEVYSIGASLFNFAKPGIIANYVGASFIF